MLTQCLCGWQADTLWGHKDGVILLTCDHCGVRRVEEVDPDTYLAQYTSGRYHANATPDRKLVNDPQYKNRFHEDWMLALGRVQRLTEVTGLHRGMLVDVGCANGAFVHEAGIQGWDAYGLDLSLDACHEDVRPYVLRGAVENAPMAWRNTVDVITFHDVLEHCLDPVRTLRFVRALLKPGGTLVIDIPNQGCPTANLKGVDFDHVKPREHLWYFTVGQLRALLEREHFVVKQIDYPFHDKMVFYAQPQTPTQEVRIFAAPGIGDLSWSLMKVQAIRALHEPCTVTVIVSARSASGLERRSEGFLALVPFVDKVEFEPFPFECDAGQMAPEFPHYLLFPNTHLELGGRIEDWRPEWETDVAYPLFAPTDAAEWAHKIHEQAGRYLFVFFFASRDFNEWAFQKNLWTVDDWVAVAEWVRLTYGVKPVIIGSAWDRSYADLFFQKVNPEHYLDVIGQTSVAQALALAREATCVIGAACGITQTAHHVGAPTVTLWSVSGISQGDFKQNFTRGFATAWTNPQYMYTYSHHVYGEAQRSDIAHAIAGVAKLGTPLVNVPMEMRVEA